MTLLRTDRPSVVFTYRNGRITPYVVDRHRCFRFRPLPRRFRNPQEAARWSADRFPSAALSLHPPTGRTTP